MATTRDMLQQVQTHVAESMGFREGTAAQPMLSPVASPKDVGRRPAKGFGRVLVEQVIPDPQQPRQEFDDASLGRLADSVRVKGQLHPIHVRWSDAAQRWVIISGERRWRACRQAGFTMVDCHFHEGQLTTAQILELQLIENLLREDLRPVEEARAFAKLLAVNAWTGKQLAETLGVPPSKVSRALALLELPAELQDQVEMGAIAARTAYELSKVTDVELRNELAQESMAGRLTTAQAANVSRHKRQKSDPNTKPIKRTFFPDNGWTVTLTSGVEGTYHDVEEALSQALAEVRFESPTTSGSKKARSPPWAVLSISRRQGPPAAAAFRFARLTFRRTFIRL